MGQPWPSPTRLIAYDDSAIKEILPLCLPLWLVFIDYCYTRSKKNHFVSFISLSSMLGIALGVMVLITVLSVMNGFDKKSIAAFWHGS